LAALYWRSSFLNVGKEEVKNVKKETLFVSFSGGRTSAFMCWWLLNHKADEYEFVFVFANTGQEHEKTLDFVNECDKRFGLNLVWLEAVVNMEHGKGIRHKEVSFASASRNGEPFEAVIKKYGIPNAALPQCSARLKVEVMESHKRSLGFKTHHATALGIRSDEIDRMNIKALKAGSIIYPLIKWRPITKSEIRYWWAEQEFDLEVPEHLGNCVTCWKKSFRKLMTIAKNEPERFDFFRRMENEFKAVKAGEQGRVFFRGALGVDDIFTMAEQGFNEFEDSMPGLQLRLLDPLDFTNGCEESCETA
jgi:hypothetical protein